MKIPPWVYTGRTAIEALVPRDSAISAVVHAGVGGALATAAALGVAQLLPKHDPAQPHRFDNKEWRERMKVILPIATFPLVLTAGMQLRQPTQQALANGIHPMYFLAAGALFGSYFLAVPVMEALEQ